MPFALEVWGKTAMFAPPEFGTERYSYPVITPSAAVGLLRSIYWHHGVIYHIDAIQVCNPIRRTSIKTNALSPMKSIKAFETAINNPKKFAELPITIGQNRAQVMSIALRDVRYIIHGHIEIDRKTAKPNMTLRKAQDILTDRIRKGKCWEQPFLGCREHTAYFKPYEPGYMNFQECCPELKGTVDFGYMLHHIAFDETGKAEGPKFYRAIMTDGIIPVYKEKDVILSDFSQTQ